jgi:sphinganine-1-phosphate aldolase
LEFEKIGTMESEILKCVLREFNGPVESCGITSSGGTESIILALCAYRNYYKKTKGITNPNIVISETAHAAFDKGCWYLNIEMRKVDQKNMQADLETMESMIDSNTIAIAGSAPDYAFGNFDDIETLGEMALKYDIGLHSDCCLGSFNLPFAAEAGFPTPYVFDFRVPGVTSISCDTHKYGYGPKGLSVLMFRDKAVRRAQIFSYADWTGGIYSTPSLAGSRPGNIIAGTWAAIMSIGREG